MSEFDSSNFLIELDSFGRPPAPHRIMGGATAREIAGKLDNINIEKQKRMRGELLAPSQNGMVQLGSSAGTGRREQIDVADANKWRNDVLSMSRPRAGFNTETADSARQFARSVASSTNHNSSTNYHGSINNYQMQSDSDDDRDTRSSSASASLPSPPQFSSPLPQSPLLKIRSDRHKRKSSDYSSASSQTHQSPSPPSQSDYSDYASLYKSLTASPSMTSSSLSPRPLSPVRKFNDAFRGAAVPVVSVNTEQQRFAPVPPANQRTAREPPSLRDKMTAISSTSSSSSSSSSQPKPRPGLTPSFGSSFTQQQRLGERRTQQPPPTGKPPAFGSIPTPSPEARAARWKQIGAQMEKDDRRLDELTQQLHRDLVMEKKKTVGQCAHCHRDMYDTEDRYTVQERTFHARCFTCEVCGKELRDQQFYLSNGRFFCKQDYLNEQTLVEQKVTRCAACRDPIQQSILTALGRNYHPSCFCCRDCQCCLDGVPFAIDKENLHVYCLPDYHERFAPRCAKCKQPITPDQNSGETVRLVIKDNSYHVGCYNCEGCGVSLSDDSDSKCYPLGRHLLCEKCHIHWSRTADQRAPITDL